MDTKVCTKCQKTLSISEFYKSKNPQPRRPSAMFSAYCKPCEKEGVKNRQYLKKLSPQDRAIEIKRRADLKPKKEKKGIEHRRLRTKQRREATKSPPPDLDLRFSDNKICGRCLAEKDFLSFNRICPITGARDRLCRICRGEVRSERRLLSREERNAHRAKRAATDAGFKERHRKYALEQWGKFPAKESARKITTRAIKKGLITKQPCKDCGEINSEAHHEDYSLPYDIVWYCKYHHSQRHRELRKEGMTWDSEGKKVLRSTLEKRHQQLHEQS